jgi:hypothetical protein
LISLGKRTAPNDTPYHEANVWLIWLNLF